MAEGKRMSDYTGIDEAPQLTPAEKAYYKQNALVTAVGKINDGASTPYSNYNIPLSEIAPSAPVSDVTVNGSSVVSDGVASVTVPTATGLAGDGLTANAGKLDVSNKVPTPTATTDRGKVLSVATDSDNIVWTTPAVTAISPKNGAITVINTANDVASGGYFFDVNTDASLATVDVSVDNTTVRKLKVANPVPPTTNASDGNVLTYKDSDGIVWAPAQGGGGAGLPDLSQLIGQETEWSASTELGREIKLFCDITSDGDKKIVSATNLRWGVDLSLGSGHYFYFT